MDDNTAVIAWKGMGKYGRQHSCDSLEGDGKVWPITQLLKSGRDRESMDNNTAVIACKGKGKYGR